MATTGNTKKRGGRHFYGARTRTDASPAGARIKEVLHNQGNSAAPAPPGGGTPKSAARSEKQLLLPSPATAKPCRVLVADDHPLVREGVVALINRQPDMQVIAEATNGREALQLFLEHHPDVTLLDLRMPDMDGIEAVAAICANSADARTVILTTYQGEEDIYRALRAGARGYLLKDSPPKSWHRVSAP